MLGVESHIIAALYAVISFGVIGLVDFGGKSKKMQLTIIFLGIIAFFFSLIYKIFREKYGGYPYKFLF